MEMVAQHGTRIHLRVSFHFIVMKWIAYGVPKDASEGYKFNFYEDKKGDFFLVVWRKPHFRRTIKLGKTLPLDLRQMLVYAHVPLDIATFIEIRTRDVLKKWM